MVAASSQRGQTNGAPLDPSLKRQQEGGQGSVELQSQRSTNYMQAILESKCEQASKVSTIMASSDPKLMVGTLAVRIDNGWRKWAR